MLTVRDPAVMLNDDRLCKTGPGGEGARQLLLLLAGGVLNPFTLLTANLYGCKMVVKSRNVDQT